MVMKTEPTNTSMPHREIWHEIHINAPPKEVYQTVSDVKKLARGCVKSLSLVETFTPVCGLYQA
jgi:hypothetical protein